MVVILVSGCMVMNLVDTDVGYVMVRMEVIVITSRICDDESMWLCGEDMVW